MKEVNSIWFFDATGNIHRDINRQKKPFFYSIVCHDTNEKSILPVAEFLTTANDQITICKYLSDIKASFHKISLKKFLPKIIVTDNSWALINSVSISFNNCDISCYINWCFKQTFDDSFDSNSYVILYLCSTHYLKNMIQKTKKITNIPNNVKKSFIFMFALIQNAIEIGQINLYLMNIHTIFSNEKLNCNILIFYFSITFNLLNMFYYFKTANVLSSLRFISKEIRTQAISSRDLFNERTPRERLRD